MARKTTKKSDNIEVTKAAEKKEIINWMITRPEGHVYVMPRIDRIELVYGFTKTDLEKMGWKFEARYAE
jgi:hypothetical protein